MKEATYWQKMEMFGSIINFITIMFAILLFCCHRKFIYEALMTMEEIPYVYKEMHLYLHYTTASVKAFLSISTSIVVIFMGLGIFIWKKFKSSLMIVCFPLYPVTKGLSGNVCSDIFGNYKHS